MFKGKISIIGAGFVGSTTAYTIMLSGLASEIVLIDINKDKAEGDVMDMNHGISFVSPVKISSGGYELVENSSVIIITAGVNQKPGETRIDLLKRNTEVFKDIFDEILKYCTNETIILVVTNPVDILTYISIQLSGLNQKNIFGSGTVLDTARLKYLIGEYADVDVRDIHAYIIGEHGDTEVAAWSLTSIAGINMDKYCVICKRCDNDKKICKNEFEMMTKNAAYDIINKKGATYYAIALSVRKIVECITGNENSILTVSSYLDGEYGIRDICLSVPTIVNSKGIEAIIESPFSDGELKALRRSADALRELAEQVGF
jgi:L-lactate dehydrogenase